MARTTDVATAAGVGAISFPVSFFGGWLALALAPILLLLITPIVVLYGLFMATRSTVEAGRILALRGLGKHQEMETRYRTAIERLMSLARPNVKPVACSCIRKHKGSYFGVVRVRNKEGSSYFQAQGDTAEEVAEMCIAQVETNKGRFPILDQMDPIETHMCNQKACHLGEDSIFHIDDPANVPTA